MSYWNQERPYLVDKPILGSTEGVETPAQATSTISKDYVSLDEYGDRVVPAGLFTSRVAGVDRFLPRAVLTAAATTSSPSLAVTPHQVFVVGDSIQVIQNYAIISLGGTWVADDTFTVTIAGIPGTHTVVGTSLANVADEGAVSLNASSAGQVAEFISDGVDNIIVFAKEPYSALSIAVAEDSTAGTIAVDGSGTELSGAGTAIGTVSAIDHANKTVTLSGNSAVALPVGARVGIAAVEEVYGLYNHSVDFDRETYKALKGITAASLVWEKALPYIDADLKRRFPKITIR